MPAIIEKTIKPSGGDYTSLSAFEAGEQRNLVTADQISYGCCYAMSDTLAVTFAGWTTDATRFIRVYADPLTRHKGVWNTSAYRMEVSEDNCIVNTQAHLRIDGLQLKMTISTDIEKAAIAHTFSGSTSQNRVRNCLIQGVISDGTVAGIVQKNGHNLDVWNTAVWNFAGGSASKGIITNGNTLTNIWNSTVYNCGAVGMSGAGTCYAVNCAVCNNTDDFGGTWTGISYCASDDGDGTNDIDWDSEATDWDKNFVNRSGGDFHLKAGADCIGAGLNDPGSGLYYQDFDGVRRMDTWDIGADEYTVKAQPASDLVSVLEKPRLRAWAYMAEQGALAEALSQKYGFKLLLEAVSESVALFEGLMRGMALIFGEGLSVLEGAILRFDRALREKVTLYDSVRLRMDKMFAEAVSLLEDMATDLYSGLSAILSEQIVLYETLFQKYGVKFIAEAREELLAVYETITQKYGVKIIAELRSEIVSLYESLSQRYVYKRICVVWSEAIGLYETVTRTLAGIIGALWREVQQALGRWTETQRGGGSWEEEQKPEDKWDEL